MDSHLLSSSGWTLECELSTGALTLERDAESPAGRDWDEQDSIAYYQCADWLFTQGRYRMTSPSDDLQNY